MKRTNWLYLACLMIVVSSTACSLKRQVSNYIPTRVAREVIGQQTNFHPLVPITTDLRNYNIIAIKNFDNLMLDQMPENMYHYLNDQVAKEISRRKMFGEVVRIEDEAELGTKADAPPTLILEGFIDNYHPGSRGLRVVELGLNHGVVTIRFQLRDRQTDEIVGSASITVYERAASKSIKSAINQAAKKAAEFISQGTKGAGKNHG